jgi:23S rRNA (uracil1939-C5)-methyltransferase
MKQIEVKIEKVAFGGAGFGHVDGKACFVPFTMPGDLVRARVKKEKKSYIEAELLELLTPSIERIDPPCPVFGDCGGCSMQQMPYLKQLAVKDELFSEQLWRFAKVDSSKVLSIQPAEEPWNYRTRVQIKISWVSNRLTMGFYRPGTHIVVPFPMCCAIASPVINTIISELQRCLPESPEPDKIPQIDISTGDDGQTIVIIHYIGDHPDEVSDFFSKCHECSIPAATGLWLRYGRKNSLQLISGIGRLSYGLSANNLTGISNLRLSFSRGGFSQVNYLQNQHLVRLASEMSNLNGHERVLDLYCGNGNFSIPLALRSREVIGIEESETSIDAARENASSNNIGNASFYCADAEAGVSRLIEEGQQFDVVLLDPPRSGAARIMELIPAMKPAKIVYISCDPVTLARDIAILKKLDYSVVRSAPVDMFPQTSHIESVTLLE